jgi:hypothetical protein
MLISSIAFYGAETWTLQKADQKYLASFEMLYWGRMGKTSWTNCAKNKVAHSQGGKEYPANNKKKEG